ncbi:cadmium resistance protein CadD (predicted permease) [Paraburkholderia youngii]
MSALPMLLATAAATFVATNIDDLALLIGWFSDRSFRAQHIAIGQFLGITALAAASIVIGLLGILLPKPIMGLLGILRIGIGAYRLIC